LRPFKVVGCGTKFARNTKRRRRLPVHELSRIAIQSDGAIQPHS
jgi:hypothetical protein